MSQTAITPWEPSKYASRRSARNPFSPMMSHTIMSRLAFAPFHITSTVFFVTFVPTVAIYRSSNASCTYRLMREVFPTATSPTKHTFTLTCFWPTNAGTAISDAQPGADLCTVRTRVSPMISIIGRRNPPGESWIPPALFSGSACGVSWSLLTFGIYIPELEPIPDSQRTSDGKTDGDCCPRWTSPNAHSHLLDRDPSPKCGGQERSYCCEQE